MIVALFIVLCTYITCDVIFQFIFFSIARCQGVHDRKIRYTCWIGYSLTESLVVKDFDVFTVAGIAVTRSFLKIKRIGKYSEKKGCVQTANSHF